MLMFFLLNSHFIPPWYSKKKLRLSVKQPNWIKVHLFTCFFFSFFFYLIFWRSAERKRRIIKSNSSHGTSSWQQQPGSGHKEGEIRFEFCHRWRWWVENIFLHILRREFWASIKISHLFPPSSVVFPLITQQATSSELYTFLIGHAYETCFSKPFKCFTYWCCCLHSSEARSGRNKNYSVARKKE